jgi:hypothetical protein
MCVASADDADEPAEEQHFGGPSARKDRHVAIGGRSSFERSFGVPHHAVQGRNVWRRDREDLSTLVHSPKKNIGPPGSRREVQPPGTAVAT